MTLNEFINKWSADIPTAQRTRECSKLRGAIAGFFERDPRTVKNWEYQTPHYVQWILCKVDEEWQQKGKRYSIFFEM